MLYILHCTDKPGSQSLRTQARLPHLQFVAKHREVFRFGGPLVGDDGTPVGSLMLLELPDRAALDRHLQADPFFGSGLFQQVSVWTTRQVVPELAPGALDAEIARQRPLADALDAGVTPGR